MVRDRVFYFLVFCFFISTVSVFGVYAQNTQSQDLNSMSQLELQTSVSVPVKFVRESPSASLDYLSINYSWIPLNDYRQELLSYESFPKGKLENDNLIIDTKVIKDFMLNVKFSTHTSSAPIEIKKKVEFPVKGVDSRIAKYTLPSEKIDINDDIRNKAVELAGNEDDLYVVVFNIADWVNSNIDYNLSSTTIDASLPSSWVYENKYGVCDELSNLFISMCRSLGIPARFVSGIAYTDDERFSNSWGPHGWAEVYFPGYGWVPFDPTYNQLGYVDASHIKFDDKLQTDKNAIEYTWLGRDIDVSSGEISIKGDVIQSSGLSEDDFTVDVDFMRDKVNLGSYNVVIANIQNLRDYYVAAEIRISRTQDIKTIDEENKDVLLAPRERKSVYWIIKAEELNRDYVYTFPMTIYSSPEENTDKFIAEEGGESITLKSARNFIEEKQSFTSGPALECSADSNTVYQYKPFEITCRIQSSSQMRFCISDLCSNENPPEIKKIINLSELGLTTEKISASYSGKTSYAFLSFNVLDDANVTMTLQSPEKVMFNEDGEVRVTLKKESENIPQNATIKISTPLDSQSWDLTSIDNDKQFLLEFHGSELKQGINNIYVELEFYDELGKRHVQSQKTDIELYNLTFFQKIYVWFNSVISA